MRSTWGIIGLAGTLALTGCTEAPLPVDGVSRPVASTSGALPSMPAEATEAPSAPASEAADAGIAVVERAPPTDDWAPDKVNSFFDAYGVVATGCGRVGVSIGAE